MVDEGRITFNMNLGFKEEFQYLYKGGIVRLGYIHARYDNPEDIKS
jgi:hypothetical protein